MTRLLCLTLIGLSMTLAACSEDKAQKNNTPNKNNTGTSSPNQQNTANNTPGSMTASNLPGNPSTGNVADSAAPSTNPTTQAVDLSGTGAPPPSSPSPDATGSAPVDASATAANSDLVVTGSNTGVPGTAVVEVAPPAASPGPSSDTSSGSTTTSGSAGSTATPVAHSTATAPALQGNSEALPTPPADPTKPAATATAPSPTSTAQTQPCAAPYQEMNPEWYPGLPAPAAKQPIYTDLPSSNASETTRYSDAHQDGLLAFAVDRANALPSSLQMNSRTFSKRIKNVRLGVDARTTGQVKVLIDLTENGKTVRVDLRGQLQNFKTASHADIKLTQMPRAGAKSTKLHYAGVLTCADLSRGCRNVVIRLDDLNPSRKIIMSAFLIHRWGSAHLTMADTDRHAFAKIPNPNQSRFAEMLSNHLNNSCLNIVESAAKAGRSLNECSKQSLFAECGNEEKKSPAYAAVGFRNWAVAYGISGFEVSFNQTLFNGVSDKAPAQAISGPLMWSPARPVTSQPMEVQGLPTVDHVWLMNNDAGGNLNFQIDFKGDPAAHMRLTVSSLAATAATQQAIERNLSAMPALPISQTAIATDQELK